MTEKARKEAKPKSRAIKLDKKALSRCGPGIRQLLLMKDEEIIQAKEKDEKRIKVELERVKKEEEERKEPVTFGPEFLRSKLKPLPHPVFGPVIVDRIRRIKIRALVNFGGNIDDLKAMGIEIRSYAHDVFTITATKQQLAYLASQPATRRIKLPRKFYPMLADAVPQAQVDQIHNLGNEGQGTIVGIIDSALDVMHHAFLDPTGAHNTRVRFMWVQVPDIGAAGDSPEDYFNNNPGTSPNFTGLNYGIIYDENAINTALGLANTYGSGANQIAQTPAASEHGTHVAGIAAGSGHLDNWASAPVNIGAAPLADIVFVATDWFEDGILDALDFIYRIAAHSTINQPAVINASLGSHVGPHDGRSDFDTARDAMLFSFLGRSMVFAAGNDNNNDGFRRGAINANQTEPAWDLHPNVGPPLGPGLPPVPVTVFLDIWYTGPELDYQISCGAGSTGWMTAGQEYRSAATGQINGYDITVLRDFETRTNMRNIVVYLPAAGVDDWTIRLRNPGTSNVNYWAWVGAAAALDGATFDELTLADTACCKGVLTVGACAKPVAPNPEMIADYSGRGPTQDNRIKPEITAVGGTTANRVQSANSGTTGVYVGKLGTSMAAPLVAGSIALLLENDPNLNQDAIKALLTQTADQVDLDIDPGAPGYDPIERNAYGFGRLRMLAPFHHSNPLADVDVWVRTADDDYGFEPYIGGCHCHAPEVKVFDSGGNETTTLNWGQEHTVGVRLHNLGDTPAVKTKVKLKYTRPWAAPDDWVACQDPANNPIEEEIDIPALGYVDLTFTQRWKPEASELPPGGAEWGDHYCLLVELDHQDDPLQYDDSTAEGRDPWTKNLKGTNNVALRNLHIH